MHRMNCHLSIKSVTVAGDCDQRSFGRLVPLVTPSDQSAMSGQLCTAQYVDYPGRLRGEGRRRAPASSGGACCGPS